VTRSLLRKPPLTLALSTDGERGPKTKLLSLEGGERIKVRGIVSPVR